MPREAIQCRNVLFGNDKHRLDLSKYCESLISICVQSGKTCFPKVRHKENNVPYWNEEVQSHKDKALVWHDIWQQCGKPRDGVVAQIMRGARHKYHYTLRSIKKNDTMLRTSRMAKALATGGDRRDIWKEVDTMERRSRQITPQIDNVTVAKCINNLLSNKYKQLLNSVPSDPSLIWPH